MSLNQLSELNRDGKGDQWSCHKCGGGNITSNKISTNIDNDKANELTPQTNSNFVLQQTDEIIEPLSLKPPQKEWESVTYHNRKRVRNSPEVLNKAKRQTFMKDYWLSQPVSTSNRFDSLGEEQVESKINEAGNVYKKVEKAPPIFVSGVENIGPLYKLLDVEAKDNYTLKILYNNQVKIQLGTLEKYIPVTEALKAKNTEFHTYQQKKDRSFKVVLRGIHASADINDLKQEIEAHNHKVLRITNMQNSTKVPLHLFLVELEPKDNNKDIYKIRNLNHSIITFEQQYKKRDIPQCSRCQAYGHTKNFCNKTPNCVKCLQKHFAKDCPRKEKGPGVKCCNCGGDHPANYKGCEIRKQLLQKMYPALRNKQLTNNQQYNYSKVTVGKTYAQQVKGNQQPGNFQQQQSSDAQQQPNNDYQQHGNIHPQQLLQPNSGLENMLTQLMSKMDTILNLLTALITKMP